jgi:hypothetical protein
MQKAALQFTKTVNPESDENLSIAVLSRLVDDWLADCQIRQHSPRTIELRRTLTGRLFWFLEMRAATHCGRAEMRQFFAYLSTGHKDSEGRWAKGQKQQFTVALRPATVNTYFHHLRAFFLFVPIR